MRLPGGPFADIASGARGPCGCTLGGEVICWGRLAEERYHAVGLPPALSIRAPRCMSISTGYGDGCVTTRTQDLWCWPQIRASWVPGAPTQRVWPEGPRPMRGPAVGSDGVLAWDLVQLNVPASPAVAVAVGDMHACAIVAIGATTLADGSVQQRREVRCWGDNDYGELSDGTLERGVVTVDLDGPETIAVGRAGSCAGTAAGVTCWGGHAVVPGELERAACRVLERQMRDPMDMGALSEPGGPCRYPARAIHDVGHVRELDVGDDFACATTDANDLVCWGRPWDRTTMPDHVPWLTTVLPATVFAHGVRTMDMQYSSGCLLSESAEVWCWGRLSRLATASGAMRSAVWLPPGVRVARVAEGQVQLCDENADADPCAP